MRKTSKCAINIQNDIKEKSLRVKTNKIQEKYNLEQILINFLQKLYSEAVITYSKQYSRNNKCNKTLDVKLRMYVYGLS